MSDDQFVRLMLGGALVGVVVWLRDTLLAHCQRRWGKRDQEAGKIPPH